MNIQALVPRIKSLLLKPKETWPVIAAEPETPQGLLTGLILPLAAIPAIAMFIGMALIGVPVPIIGNVRLSFGWALMNGIINFGFALGGVFLLALIIDLLAEKFGATKNYIQSLKLAAYCAVPGWVAGVLHIIPLLGSLALLAGIYGLYLLYIGLPVLKQCPAEKQTGYFVVSLVSMIGVGIVAGVLMGVLRMGVGSGSGGDQVQNETLRKWEEIGKKYQDAADKTADQLKKELDNAKKKMEVEAKKSENK